MEIDEKRLVADEYESRTTDGVRLFRAAIVEKHMHRMTVSSKTPRNVAIKIRSEMDDYVTIIR